MSVAIVQLSRGWEQWEWLCPKCLTAKKKQGWEEKAKKPPPHALRCQGCGRKDGDEHERETGLRQNHA